MGRHGGRPSLRIKCGPSQASATKPTSLARRRRSSALQNRPAMASVHHKNDRRRPGGLIHFHKRVSNIETRAHRISTSLMMVKQE
jgi:hypothetical protein